MTDSRNGGYRVVHALTGRTEIVRYGRVGRSGRWYIEIVDEATREPLQQHRRLTTVASAARLAAYWDAIDVGTTHLGLPGGTGFDAEYWRDLPVQLQRVDALRSIPSSGDAS
jgi:hypothetical protein